MDTATSASVVVIGAGVAGVCTALKLIHNGFRDVIVLEAQDYIGGRVKAVSIDGTSADMGAQFIHGRVGNPVYDIAKKLKRIPYESSINDVEEKLINPCQVFYTSTGQQIRKDDVDGLLSLLDETVDEDNARGMPGSVQNALDTAFGEFLLDNVENVSTKQGIYDAVFRWYCKYYKIDNGAEDLHHMTVDCSYVVLPGDRFTDVDGGMSGIITALADQLPAEVVKLNTPVTRIDWLKEQSAHSVSSSESKPVLVTCQDGHTISADHVVVTVSLGCLKATHKTLFHPQLPIPVQQAVEHSGYGAIGKIYLQFEEDFWESLRPPGHDDFFESFELLWVEPEVPVIKSDRSQKKTKYGQPWWYGLHSLETVHSLPNILEIWLTEEQVEVCEELEDAEVMNVCTEVIRLFFRDVQVPDPVAVFRTKWLTNPYTRGTYSYQTVKMTETDLQNLGRPLPSREEPRVLFAGEAYSEKFYSTIHGTLLTGDGVADLLLDKYGHEIKTKLIDMVSC